MEPGPGAGWRRPADRPRLQDLLDPEGAFGPLVHPVFELWVPCPGELQARRDHLPGVGERHGDPYGEAERSGLRVPVRYAGQEPPALGSCRTRRSSFWKRSRDCTGRAAGTASVSESLRSSSTDPQSRPFEQPASEACRKPVSLVTTPRPDKEISVRIAEIEFASHRSLVMLPVAR